MVDPHDLLGSLIVDQSFAGPALFARIKRELSAALAKSPGNTLSTLTGRTAETWAARSLEG